MRSLIPLIYHLEFIAHKDKPKDLAAYTTKSLAEDLAALLDYIGVPKAVIDILEVFHP